MSVSLHMSFKAQIFGFFTKAVIYVYTDCHNRNTLFGIIIYAMYIHSQLYLYRLQIHLVLTLKECKKGQWCENAIASLKDINFVITALCSL